MNKLSLGITLVTAGLVLLQAHEAEQLEQARHDEHTDPVIVVETFSVRKILSTESDEQVSHADATPPTSTTSTVSHQPGDTSSDRPEPETGLSPA